MTNGSMCEHRRQELRRKTTSNGGVQFRYQCLDCGQTVGKMAIPHQEALNLGGADAREFDDELRDRQWKKSQDQRERQRSQLNEQWRERYDEHITSEKWLKLRQLVLARDKHVCQGCLTARASEVHHLTYAHMGDEFAFELTSLCWACHDRLHDQPAG